MMAYWVGRRVALFPLGYQPMNKTSKVLGFQLDTHFPFGPHARDCVEHTHNVMKTLAGSK